MKGIEVNTSSDVTVSEKNLHRLNLQQKALIDIRRALLKELSSSMLKGEKEILKNLNTLFERDVLDNTSDKYLQNLSVLDKIELCRNAAADLMIDRELKEVLFGQDEKCSPDAIGKVAYMKNHYADAAFLMFSRSVSAPRSFYLTSTQAVCEEVYSGGCEYCILPIETDTDGKLMTFYSMIDKYELKIHSVCTVRYADNQSFTKFALLKKSISGTGIFNVSQAYLNKRMLEIKISQTSQNDSPLYDILKAADACSLKLLRIDSLPLSYNRDLLGYYTVFSINQADFKTFLIYLALESPQSYIIGYYSSVN